MEENLLKEAVKRRLALTDSGSKVFPNVTRGPSILKGEKVIDLKEGEFKTRNSNKIKALLRRMGAFPGNQYRKFKKFKRRFKRVAKTPAGKRTLQRAGLIGSVGLPLLTATGLTLYAQKIKNSPKNKALRKKWAAKAVATRKKNQELKEIYTKHKSGEIK